MEDKRGVINSSFHPLIYLSIHPCNILGENHPCGKSQREIILCPYVAHNLERSLVQSTGVGMENN